LAHCSLVAVLVASGFFGFGFHILSFGKGECGLQALNLANATLSLSLGK